MVKVIHVFEGPWFPVESFPEIRTTFSVGSLTLGNFHKTYSRYSSALDFRTLFILQMVMAGKGNWSMVTGFVSKETIIGLLLYLFQTSFMRTMARTRPERNAISQKILQFPEILRLSRAKQSSFLTCFQTFPTNDDFAAQYISTREARCLDRTRKSPCFLEDSTKEALLPC